MTEGDALRPRPELPDSAAMFALADGIEQRAHALLEDARELYRRSAKAGCLDATLALARLAAKDRKYQWCGLLLYEARRRYPDVPASRLVTVAPDVLGPKLKLDGDGSDDDHPGAGNFTVLSYEAQRAAAAVARVAPRLMDVNEHGAIQTMEDVDRLTETGEEIPYTPNFLFDVGWSGLGAVVSLDTKGSMTAAMGRTMVGILVDALIEDAVPAHITGDLPDVGDSEWRVWEPPDAAGEPRP